MGSLPGTIAGVVSITNDQCEIRKRRNVKSDGRQESRETAVISARLVVRVRVKLVLAHALVSRDSPSGASDADAA